MGGGTTKQVSENKPPAWAKPLFETSASEAQKIYDSGAGGGVYQGQTVAGLGNTTQQGIAGVSNAAKNYNTGANTYNAFGQLGNQANQSGNAFSNALTGVAAGAGAKNVTTEKDYRNVLGQAQEPTAAGSYLTDYASGKFLNGEGNPFYRERLEREIGDSNALIQSAFSGSGRYGSGANQNTIADNTSNMLLSGLESDYNRQQQNQFNAVSAIDAAKNAAIGNQLNAVSGITGVQTGNADRSLSAAGLQGNLLGNAANIANQGITTALGAKQQQAGLDQQNFQNQLAGSQAQIQAGQLQDQAKQQGLTADMGKWMAEDMQDWTRLGLLQSAAAGSAGNYGTNTQTQTSPSNPLAAIGGIGSMMAKSDARLKENITPIGVENGHVIYEWNYVGGDALYHGVMAQDLFETAPEAVVMEPDGYFAVDYSKIGVSFGRVH